MGERSAVSGSHTLSLPAPEAYGKRFRSCSCSRTPFRPPPERSRSEREEPKAEWSSTANGTRSDAGGMQIVQSADDLSPSPWRICLEFGTGKGFRACSGDRRRLGHGPGWANFATLKSRKGYERVETHDTVGEGYMLAISRTGGSGNAEEADGPRVPG
jgi:hypothetical protein